MNQAHKDPAQRPSSSDSLFGMALAQAFTAMVLGPAADLIWEAGEVASIVHEDRTVKRTNGRVYEMGVKRSLMEDFARPAQDWAARVMPMAPARTARTPAFSF